MIVRGYISESDLWRVDAGASGSFAAEAPQRSRIAVKVREITPAGAGQIEILDLASTFGGRIAVNQDEKRRLVPIAAQYAVRMLAAPGTPAQDLISRGVAIIDGRRESLFAQVLRRSIIVLLRESGF